MKVKEVDRTANIAWSPQTQVPIYLATGTAAQQLDASFSTNSNLEIYGLNLSETGHDMPCLASLPVDQRFHRVVWGGAGVADDSMPSGLIAGGADRGVISMYDAAKLVKGEDDAMVFSQDKHTGPVAALDFNPFQENLLASGGSESEIYIWDVNKLGTPMTPGAKSQPFEDVRSVAWNRQVQHIMASTFASRCVVWDLRKNDPIIKVSDSTSRARYKVVAWHPDVATQLCLASEDDHTPVIQIWDLRQASSPMKILEGHTKGVLSVAWCQADSDLLLSCGKDNRILVWNPNQGQGEIVAELPTSNQWSFEVNWCPRNPAVIASASFDGRVSVYSLMGGQQQVQPTNRITESFGTGSEIPDQAATPQVTMQLKTPPKWLRRPCGATFGFGGQLVSWEKGTGVFISKVVTEPQLVTDSAKLEVSLAEGNFTEFCDSKLACVPAESSKGKLWNFLKASFGEDATSQYLSLLGIDLEQIRDKLNNLMKSTIIEEANVEDVSKEIDGLEVNEGGDEFDLIGAGQPLPVIEGGDEFDLIGAGQPLPVVEGGDEFDLIAAGQPLPQDNLLLPSLEDLPLPSPLDKTFSFGQEDPLILALLAGDLKLAVDICVKEKRFAEALILAIKGGNELLVATQAKFFQYLGSKDGGSAAALVEAVSMEGWQKLVNNSSLDSWREVLAALVTYTDTNTRQTLAARLADRLADCESTRSEAMLCYVVAGNLDRVVDCWMQVEVGGDAVPTTAGTLQELVEVVVMVKAAVQARGLPVSSQPGERLSAALGSYAGLLAAQGSLSAALVYLSDVGGEDTDLARLKQRLEKSLAQPQQPPPARKVSVAPVQSTVQRNVSGGSVYGGSDRGSRRTSMDPQFGNFNTGPVGNTYGVGGGQPNLYNPAPTQYNLNQPPTQRAPTPVHQPPPPVQQPYLQPAPPPVEPVQTFQPAQNDSSTAPPNPLMRRNRALDPSIGSSGGTPNYNQFMQPTQQPSYMQPTQQPTYMQPTTQPSYLQPTQQPSYLQPTQQPTYGTQPQYNYEQQPTQSPSMFTPELTPAPMTPGLPPPVGHNVNTPDHGGPGFKPVVSSGSGWNDPPPMITRSPNPPPVTSTSDMITCPIFTPEPIHTQQPASSWGGFQPAAPQQPAQIQGFQAQEQQQPQVQELAPVEAAPPAPIPAEHQVIQDVFESLRLKCHQAASHPQVRRKLEDVSSKLDILYNKLRDNTLSPTTLQGLHAILQHIWQYDYPSCMKEIAGLISSGSFAEMSYFMPGVKVLLQVAQQQGVYVEYQQ